MRRVPHGRMRFWALALLRAALVVIVFHTSGLAHLAADIHEVVTTGHHAGSPFDVDDDDASSAPGSPTCHHAQPGAASLASSACTFCLAAAVDARLEVAPPAGDVESAPDLRSVFRPPRA